MQSDSNTDLLVQLKTLVDILNNSLPTEIPFSLSYAIDPVRAAVFREACLYRVAELAESAYEDFLKDRLVAALILARAYMETEALFFTFAEKLENALETRDINDIQAFLTDSMLGVKDEQLKQLKNPQDPSFIPNPKNILTYIRKISKQIPHYNLHYASLSEFSHPNAAGTVDAYVLLDYENRVARLERNRRKLCPELALPQLVGSLECFLDLYDNSAKLLQQFVPLCESLLPQKEMR